MTIIKPVHFIMLNFTFGIIAMANSQEKPTLPVLSEPNTENLFKPFVVMETWATHSFNKANHANRTDISVRRLRFGASGKPYAWLSYQLQLHADRLGTDNYAATKGKYIGVDIWNGYLTAKLLPKSELLYLHAGYYWSAISREYNTIAWTQGSFDRTRANFYMRHFITGKGNGVESGMGIGGLKNFNGLGISYRLGSFEPEAYTSNKFHSRLYTAHILFSFGQPEMTKYKYRLAGNHWQNRKGITLGLGGSSQYNGQLNDSLYFKRSYALGADLLANFKGFRVDAEYFLFERYAVQLTSYYGRQWHIRTGYSFKINNTYVEPAVTFDRYDGTGNKMLYKYIGNDYTLDIGLNWYINHEKLKLSVHYLMQNGTASPKNGDYIGTALQLKIY